MTKQKRIIGVYRVSEVGAREPDNLHSPDIQRDRIRAAADGARLIDILPEVDVSGRKPLDKRPGLLAAVQAIEAGEADAVMVAYFDRLARSLKVQHEVVDRVEAAGGEVLTLDFGKVSNGTAIQRLTGSLIGAVHEYVAEQVGEKAAEGQARAVAAGKFIGPKAPVGYVKGTDGRLQPARGRTPAIVLKAFQRRARGHSASEVRAWLAKHGVKLSEAGTRQLLANRVYLGEVNFGKLRNPAAHPPLVPRDLFDAVQRTFASAGRHAKSERLLARQGVVFCATCGGRMSVSGNARYPYYRCASDDCDARATFQADQLEDAVVAVVREQLADASGRATARDNAARAEADVAAASDALARAIRGFAAAGVADEAEAIAEIQRLRDARDAAQAALDRLPPRRTVKLTAARDWEKLTLDEQRALVKTVIGRVTVAPGRGSVIDRVTIELNGD